MLQLKISHFLHFFHLYYFYNNLYCFCESLVNLSRNLLSQLPIISFLAYTYVQYMDCLYLYFIFHYFLFFIFRNALCSLRLFQQCHLSFSLQISYSEIFGLVNFGFGLHYKHAMTIKLISISLVSYILASIYFDHCLSNTM